MALRDNGSLVLGQRGSGSYHLDGGVLEVGGVNRIRRGNSGAASFQMGGGTLKFSEASSIGSDIDPVLKAGTSSTMDTNGYDVSISGVISGSGNLIKQGTGRLSLLANNTLTGSTEVQSGELTVDGTLTGSSLTVDSGATLNGDGLIAAATTIDGILAPGNSPAVMSFTNGLTLGAGSTTEIEIFANSTSNRGTDFDGLDVSGAFTVTDGATFSIVLNGVGSTVDFDDVFWTSDQSWLIVAGDESPNVGETVLVTVSEDSQGASFDARVGEFAFVVDGNNYRLNFTAAEVIPEPNAFALIGGLMALGAVMRRRGRSGDSA